jgi:hypothetical protein
MSNLTNLRISCKVWEVECMKLPGGEFHVVQYDSIGNGLCFCRKLDTLLKLFVLHSYLLLKIAHILQWVASKISVKLTTMSINCLNGLLSFSILTLITRRKNLNFFFLFTPLLFFFQIFNHFDERFLELYEIQWTIKFVHVKPIV